MIGKLRKHINVDDENVLSHPHIPYPYLPIDNHCYVSLYSFRVYRYFCISPFVYKTQYSILAVLHFALFFPLDDVSGRDFLIGT